MENWISDLEYVLMPSSKPVQGYENKYEAAYQCWREAWNKFRSEININEPLYSDGFILPHETGALFYKGECVGMSSFTYGDLSNGPMKDHSWFLKGWSDLDFQKLKNISNNALICSQFTVSPKFAGKGHFVRWKEIVFLYTFMRFVHSTGDVMAGQLNLSRGVQNACGESFGATILNPSHPFNFYGVELPAQLVAYEKKNIKAMQERKNIVQMCEDLWSRLIHISDHAVITKHDLNKEVA